MPTGPSAYCLEPGCSAIVPSGRCDQHRRQVTQRRATVSGHRWYSTARWRRLRDHIRYTTQPFCNTGCGRLTTQVDHIVPHQGDEQRFFDVNNLQGLCAQCHGAKTRAGQ